MQAAIFSITSCTISILLAAVTDVMLQLEKLKRRLEDAENQAEERLATAKKEVLSDDISACDVMYLRTYVEVACSSYLRYLNTDPPMQSRLIEYEFLLCRLKLRERSG